MEMHLARTTKADLTGMVEVVAAVENGEDLVVVEVVSEAEEDTETAGKYVGRTRKAVLLEFDLYKLMISILLYNKAFKSL